MPSFERIDEIAILRIDDARFVEYWALEDTAGRLQQLGVSVNSWAGRGIDHRDACNSSGWPTPYLRPAGHPLVDGDEIR